MEKQDCWMSFSEALERYLTAREEAKDAPPGSDRRIAAEDVMEMCQDHMDALTR